MKDLLILLTIFFALPLYAQKKPLIKQDFDPKNFFVLHGGMSDISYKQKITSPYLADLSFQSVKSPALQFDYLRNLGPNWDLFLFLQNNPGSASSSPTTRIPSGNFQTLSFGGEGRYMTERAEDIRFLLLVGAKSADLLFLDRIDVNELKVSRFNVFLLTAGIGAQWAPPFSKWSFEGFLKPSFPLSTPKDFSMKNPVFVQMTAAVDHKINSRWTIGASLEWNSQSYQVSNHQDAPTGANVSGSQEVLFTNTSARLGYRW